jgi:hypothetical protein
MDIQLVQFSNQSLGYGVVRGTDLLLSDVDYNTVSASYASLVDFHQTFTASALPTDWGVIPANTVASSSTIPVFNTGAAQ